jgi:uncharacterized membrane protein YfcA
VRQVTHPSRGASAVLGVVDVENALWLVLVIGVFIGWFLGRWTAENRRARSDMNRVWNSRKNYRDD